MANIIQMTVMSEAVTDMAAAAALGNSLVMTASELGQGQYTPLKTMTGVQTPFSPAKQFTTTQDFAGHISGSGVVEFGFLDASAPSYDVAEIALWYLDPTETDNADNRVDPTKWKLFSLYSKGPNGGLIRTKGLNVTSAWTMAVQFVDGDGNLLTVNVTFPDTVSFAYRSASTTRHGIVELATADEVDAPPNATVVLHTDLMATLAQAQTTIANLTNKALMTPLRTWNLIASKIASQAEALAGTANNRLMTPLRAKQSVLHFAPQPVAAQRTSGQSSGSEADAGLSVTITPTATTKKILLELQGGDAIINGSHYTSNVNDNRFYAGIYKSNGTKLAVSHLHPRDSGTDLRRTNISSRH